MPGDAPTAATRQAPTPAEMREGQPLDERLAEEEPEDAPAPGGLDSGSGEPAGPERTDPERTGPAGELYEGPEAAPPRRQDVHAEAEGGSAGLSAEEEAVRTRTEADAEEADESQP
ncbi:hypothetical protein [Streptomyces sp. ODS28]|uniref:hypothetical protein n=1 Tax=Streptomyces sp. ODS28 TaxID=3136688 RepID=UPI0031E55A42